MMSSNKAKGHDSNSRLFFKFISLLLSFLLWFYVLNSEPQLLQRSIPIEVVSPRGLSVANEIPGHASVKLKGSRAFIRNALREIRPIKIDLKSYPYKKRKTFNVNISNADVTLPFGIDILEINPSEIKVKLEKTIIKKLPVKVITVNSVSDELKLIESKVSPTHVHVQGPIELMRKLTNVKTHEVDLNELKDEGEFPIGIEELDRRLKLRKSYSFNYLYKVRPKKANLSLNNIKIKFLSSTKKFKTKNKAVSLDVLAPEGKKIRSSEVKVIADIPDKRGVHFVKLKATLPDRVYLLKIKPETIKVRVP